MGLQIRARAPTPFSLHGNSLSCSQTAKNSRAENLLRSPQHMRYTRSCGGFSLAPSEGERVARCRLSRGFGSNRRDAMGTARRSRKSEVRRGGAKFIRGRRFLSSGPFNRRDAKSAERETFPSIFSLHCHSRDCSQPAKKRRGLPRPVYRSVRACLRSSVIADHFRRLLYSFGVSRQHAGVPDGTPGF